MIELVGNSGQTRQSRTGHIQVLICRTKSLQNSL